MKFTVAEWIQITIGLAQLFLGYLAIRKQSKPSNDLENSNKKSNGNITFFNSMDRFDFFALFVSLGCLVSGAIFSLPSISENFERLMKYSLLAISSSVFTLTIIRIQTNKITRIVHYAYENAKLDGGNF